MTNEQLTLPNWQRFKREEVALMSEPQDGKLKIIGPPVPVPVKADPVAFGVGHEVQAGESIDSGSGPADLPEK